MTEPSANPRWRRFQNYLLVATAAGILVFGGALWYSTTDSFQSMVRRRLIAELERVTGGRVELGGFHSIPLRLKVDVRDLTIHGREAPGEVPYAHVDRLVAGIKVISALGAEFGFSSVVLDRPVVHIIVYPDGTTNQPEPKVKSISSESALEKLFSLSIGQLEIRKGEFLWNDQKTPLDCTINDVSADMAYSLLHRRYETNLLLGKIGTEFQDYRPVAWMLEAHFSLSQNGVVVKALTATSGRSRLEASGQLQDFRQPKITGAYIATIDLAEASAIARQRTLRQGVLQVSGRGSWDAQEFSSAGKLSLKDFEWRDQSFALRNAALNSDFNVTRQRLVLSQIQAKLLGGEVSGDADVVNWLAPPPTGKAARNAPEEKGSVRLRLKDLSANEIAIALSSAARPFHRLNLAGATNGSLESHWRGSIRRAETEIAVDVVAPVKLAPAQLPLNAHVRGFYRHATSDLQLSEFNASTRSTQVRAEGTLSSSTALRFSLSTRDLSEWEPILQASGYQDRVPVRLQGRAYFEGTASGKVSDITLAGRIQSENFEFILPATASVPRKELPWDYLTADVQLSPHLFAAHNGILRHGNTAINFDFSLGLQERRFTSNSPLTAHLEMRNTDVSETLALAGYDYPVTGAMNLSLQARGTRADPQGQARIELSHATMRGEPFQHFDSTLQFGNGEVSLRDFHLTHYEAHVTGSGAYNFTSHAVQFDVSGTGFDLMRVPQLQRTRVRIEGQMDFTAQGKGTLEAPAISAKLRLHDLMFEGESAGDYTFDAATQGADLHLAGRAQSRNAQLDIDGDIRLREDWPATVYLHFNHLDVDSLLRAYLQSHLTGHSAVAGDLQLQGPLLKPSELQVAGNLSEFAADVDNIKARNSGPIRFAIAKQSLTLEHFHLIGEGTDLTVGGAVQLKAPRELELHAEGHANLQLIQILNPDFTSSGVVTVNLNVAGTMAHPTTAGRLQITAGSVAYKDLPSALSDINGSLVFNQDRLQIESLTAHVGGGSVSFGGYANLYNRQLNFNLTLDTQDVRVRYPAGVSSITNAQLRFAGTQSASVLSGDITVTKLAIAPGFDFGSYLERSAQSPALPQTNPLLNRIRMDVHVSTTPELQMQTAVVRLSGDADLHLRGTAAKPVLLGRADIIEGEIYFNGTKYRLERGDVTFTNPVTTTPVLDLQASTHVRDYDITVNLNGSADKLNMTYHSEPPLATADIISLLALGQTQQQSAQLSQSGQSPFASQAASAVLSEALNSALSNRSRSLFGISHIKIDPQGMNTETSPTTSTPAVTIEQQVKDNLTLTYTTNVSQTSQQIIQAEYNVTRNVSILAVRDYNGVVSFEVRIRKRKK